MKYKGIIGELSSARGFGAGTWRRSDSDDHRPPIMTFRERIAEAAGKYDGYVTHGSLEAIMVVLTKAFGDIERPVFTVEMIREDNVS